MLVLRFMVGLGVGGVWPNAVALVAECWPDKARPAVAGVMGAAINAGILMLSQIAQLWSLTADSWRWLFTLAAVPAALGLLVWFFLPESPAWLATRGRRPATDPPRPCVELFRPPLLKITLIGIMLGSIPLVGAWAASKWMIPWADQIGGVTQPDYKAMTQGWWAFGAMLGSLAGGQIASLLGRRRSYFLISLGSMVLTIAMFQLTAPLQPSFFSDRLRAGLCRDALLRLAAAVSAGALPDARARHGQRNFLQCRPVRDGGRSAGGRGCCSRPLAAATRRSAARRH